MTSSLTTIARGAGSGIVEARRTIVRDAGQWRALWAAHAGPAATAPEVDFTARMVAAAFAGERPTPGFEIEITGLGRDGQALTLAVTERSPAPGMMAAQMIVTPFHIVTLPRYDGEVRFESLIPNPPPSRVQEAVRFGAAGESPASARAGQTARFGEASPELVAPADRATSGGGRVPSSPTSRVREPARFGAAGEPPSSTGLDANVAAGLAYLAGPFSGVLILLVERANLYVRFHAWQAVVGLGGLGALAVGVLILSFLTLLLSPFVFTVLYRLSEAIAVAWVVAWVICLVKAFTGRAWKMPVLGRYAEQLAARRP